MPITVAKIMTPDPVVVRSEKPLCEVASLMQQTGYNGFPVVDEEGKLIGIIEVEDLLPHPKAVPFSDVEILRFLDEWIDVQNLDKMYHRLCQFTVGQVMRTKITWVHPEDSVGKALKALRESEAERLPVTDPQGHPVGLIARSNFLKLVTHNQH